MIESIERVTRAALQSSTSKIWDTLVQSPDEKLKDVLGAIFLHLKSGTLIDLGSGADQTIADMFIHAGTKRYIGVDAEQFEPTRRIPFTSYKHADMQSFMEQSAVNDLLYDGTFPSINFMFNAINGPVMASEKLSATLRAAVPWLGDGDYIFGVNSPEVKEWLARHADYYNLRPAYVNPSSPFFAFKRVLDV